MVTVLLCISIFLSVVIIYLLITGNRNGFEKKYAEEMARSREEMNNSMIRLSELLTKNVTNIGLMQKNQLDSFSKNISDLSMNQEFKLESMRSTLENSVRNLQADNNAQLEKMRVTVDEKLTSTLEKRLGSSFQLVSDRLELVSKGLGEMRNLAQGVGDLKKVMSNIKVRGIWGEIQLGNLINEMLTQDQYVENFPTKKGSNERVEFAIKIPSKDDNNSYIYIPVDSKFPLEDYERVLDAEENCDKKALEDAMKNLEIRIKSEAKDIREKYIDPPNTTDFGILFLPVEGLYAEVLRIKGLTEFIQNEYRVVISGPTTLLALLNSLQLGFKSLAIEKRTSEVWQLLGIVKTEFMKFGDILEKTQKKLQEASNTIEKAAQKSRTIEKKLTKVQELPADEMDAFQNIDDEDLY